MQAIITAGEFFAAKKRKQKLPAEKSWHHNVYVIELDPKVLRDKKFIAANPNYNPEMACLYVGCTGMSPEMRFLNHKRGYKSNRYAKRYGVKLRPDLFACYNPMPYEAAAELEVELANGLREDGYAVWQA